MPGGNRRGPDGLGPMTGRKMGYCGNNNQGLFKYIGGLACGRGNGFARASGRMGLNRNTFLNQNDTVFPTEYNKEDELSFLKRRSEELQEALNNINNEIKHFENE